MMVPPVTAIQPAMTSTPALSNLDKAPREMGSAVADAASRLTFGLLDFLERNPDRRREKRLGEAPAPVNAAPASRPSTRRSAGVATSIAGRRRQPSGAANAAAT